MAVSLVLTMTVCVSLVYKERDSCTVLIPNMFFIFQFSLLCSVLFFGEQNIK